MNIWQIFSSIFLLPSGSGRVEVPPGLALLPAEWHTLNNFSKHCLGKGSNGGPPSPNFLSLVPVDSSLPIPIFWLGDPPHFKVWSEGGGDDCGGRAHVNVFPFPAQSLAELGPLPPV